VVLLRREHEHVQEGSLAYTALLALGGGAEHSHPQLQRVPPANLMFITTPALLHRDLPPQGSRPRVRPPRGRPYRRYGRTHHTGRSRPTARRRLPEEMCASSRFGQLYYGHEETRVKERSMRPYY
jgi:hypothetical protein